MKDTRPMHFTIRSTLTSGDDTETMTTTAAGKYAAVGDHITLSFWEANESGKVFTTLAFLRGGRRVHMKRRGGVKCEMIFDPKEECTSVYELPPLKFDFTVRSREVFVNLDENGGTVSLAYTREIGGDLSSVQYCLTAVAGEEDA